jgi:hypothetical protein
MTTIAVRIPEEWKERMARFPIRWSDVLRAALEERLEQLEREKVIRAFVAGPSSATGQHGEGVRSIREDRDGG